jgi:hypothetical protein
MMVSGAIGEIVFDRRGFIRRKGVQRDAKTPAQGNFRQAMTTAQKCAGVCGPDTRRELRAVADKPTQWVPFLNKRLLGARRARYRQLLDIFHGDAVDRERWDTAAIGIGLKPVHYDYADELPVSPGAQLFLLVATLHELGIYPELGYRVEPGGVEVDVETWAERVVT